MLDYSRAGTAAFLQAYVMQAIIARFDHDSIPLERRGRPVRACRSGLARPTSMARGRASPRATGTQSPPCFNGRGGDAAGHSERSCCRAVPKRSPTTPLGDALESNSPAPRASPSCYQLTTTTFWPVESTIRFEFDLSYGASSVRPPALALIACRPRHGEGPCTGWTPETSPRTACRGTGSDWRETATASRSAPTASRSRRRGARRWCK